MWEAPTASCPETPRTVISGAGQYRMGIWCACCMRCRAAAASGGGSCSGRAERGRGVTSLPAKLALQHHLARPCSLASILGTF